MVHLFSERKCSIVCILGILLSRPDLAGLGRQSTHRMVHVHPSEHSMASLEGFRKNNMHNRGVSAPINPTQSYRHIYIYHLISQELHNVSLLWAMPFVHPCSIQESG